MKEKTLILCRGVCFPDRKTAFRSFPWAENSELKTVRIIPTEYGATVENSESLSRREVCSVLVGYRESLKD